MKRKTSKKQIPKNWRMFNKTLIAKATKIGWKDKFLLFFKPMHKKTMFQPWGESGVRKSIIINYKKLHGKMFIYDIIDMLQYD